MVEKKDKSIVMEYLLMRGVKVLNSDEEKELFIRYNNGDEAAKTIIFESNLPLVRSIVRQFNDSRLSYDDFFQVGAMGLLSAIENFDLSREIKFSTYATEYISGGIKKLISTQSRIIDIPNEIFWLVNRYYNYYYNDYDVIDREPTREEVMKALEIDDFTYEKLEKAKYDSLSYEQLISDEILDIEELEDFSIEPYEDTVYRNMLKPWALGLLELLPEKRREMVKHRFGLEGAKSETYEELGKRYGKSYQAVTYNMDTIMKHLKNTCYAKGQLEYEDDLNVKLDVALNASKISFSVGDVIISALDENIFSSSDEVFIAGLLFGLTGKPVGVDKILKMSILDNYSFEEKKDFINSVISKYVMCREKINRDKNVRSRKFK